MGLSFILSFYSAINKIFYAYFFSFNIEWVDFTMVGVLVSNSY